ncbi:MAG: hypothetical protein KA369_08060 [Spirochaetes bacterium]|nr:hypothetical protein [Spirochaetota bacterium]
MERNLAIQPRFPMVMALLLMAGFPVAVMTAEPDPDRSSAYNECDARCATLDGESRYRCVKTCINTKKRNAPVGNNEVKKKISDCEKLCEPYKGIDNVTCRRLCLDNKRYNPPKKKEPETNTDPSPCETRCGALSGPSRDTCISRCEKKSRFDSRRK